ncbi:MAG: response regulator transcription factor [Lachnospiraceae bacterium]|nr:response regulator transcription factor [Lachnospiraceae bacterium]
MNIALVDDMPRELKRLSGIIEEYAAEHYVPVELKTFVSAEELLSVYRPLQYTLIFMDIYMEGMTGVEAVKAIREKDKETLIVFLTTSTDHAFDAFKVHAFQYIIKVPEMEAVKADIWRVLDEVAALHNKSEAGITIAADGNEHTFPYSEILYAQTDKNYIRITDRHGQTFLTRMTFSGIRSLLEQDSRFLQINRGIIINMDYIDSFGKEACVLHGGFHLPINLREQKKLDQIRRNYVFSRLHNRQKYRGGELL